MNFPSDASEETLNMFSMFNEMYNFSRFSPQREYGLSVDSDISENSLEVIDGLAKTHAFTIKPKEIIQQKLKLISEKKKEIDSNTRK